MKKIVTATALAMACGVACAQDNTFDPRSLAMGGVGVASSNPSDAAFHNAALLTSPRDKNEDDFAWEIPIIGLRVQDEQELNSGLSQLRTDGDNLTNSANAFQAAYNSGGAAAAQSSAGALSAALSSFGNSMSAISQKAVSGNALAGTMMAFPSNGHAVALYYDMRVELGAMFNYAAADQTTINTLAANLNACSTGNTQSCTTAYGSLGANGQVNGLVSQLMVRGVKARDIGIAMARHFDYFGGLDIGIVPKITKFSTYDFALAAQNQPKITLDQGQADYSAFNLDIGTAKEFKTKGGDDIKAGLAIRDMLSKSFTTVRGNTVDVKPRVTAGISYVTALTNTGLDLDLTPNKPMITGLIKDSQFVRFGTEFDAWGWMQIRLGYRHDLKGNYVGLPSVGLGLSPFGGVIHFDLSVAYANKQEGAASMQFGCRF